MRDFLTTRQAGQFLGHPEWRIRRAVDALGCAQEFGGKRAVPRDRLGAIDEFLRARGMLPKVEAAAE
jgi:hypothetical protein